MKFLSVALVLLAPLLATCAPTPADTAPALTSSPLLTTKPNAQGLGFLCQETGTPVLKPALEQSIKSFCAFGNGRKFPPNQPYKSTVMADGIKIKMEYVVLWLTEAVEWTVDGANCELMLKRIVGRCQGTFKVGTASRGGDVLDTISLFSPFWILGRVDPI